MKPSLGDERVVSVRSDAILSDGDVRRLFVVREDRAFELVVRTGATRENRTVVYEDLAPDTPVIRHPPTTLRDGSPVKAGAGARANVTTTGSAAN